MFPWVLWMSWGQCECQNEIRFWKGIGLVSGCWVGYPTVFYSVDSGLDCVRMEKLSLENLLIWPLGGQWWTFFREQYQISYKLYWSVFISVYSEEVCIVKNLGGNFCSGHSWENTFGQCITGEIWLCGRQNKERFEKNKERLKRRNISSRKRVNYIDNAKEG